MHCVTSKLVTIAFIGLCVMKTWNKYLLVEVVYFPYYGTFKEADGSKSLKTGIKVLR